MKIQNWLAASLLYLAVEPGFAQGAVAGVVGQVPAQSGAHQLVTFDLDFPGGTARELVTAIEKASGHSLNAIVPQDLAETRVPGLKMKNVNVAQLFDSLSVASRRVELTPRGTFNTAYGFRQQGGSISDDTIWTFFVEKPLPNPVPKACRFYSLGRYLEAGITVDDITTAIKTGAEMLGEGAGPTISFHKDTKLLIAVGEPSKLEIIDAVLKALDPGQVKARSFEENLNDIIQKATPAARTNSPTTNK